MTRLLKDSLGGKTRTCIIATVSIAKMNQEEIISTLDYANRAKNIRNKPEANHPTNRNVYISDLEMKIEQLKGDLQVNNINNKIVSLIFREKIYLFLIYIIYMYLKHIINRLVTIKMVYI